MLVCAGKIGIKEQILVLAQLAQQLVSATNGVSVACTFGPKNWIRTAHELQAPTLAFSQISSWGNHRIYRKIEDFFRYAFIGSAMLDIQCVSLEQPWALWVSQVSLAGYQSSLHLVFFFGSFRTGE